MSTPEGEIVKAILEWLAIWNIFAWRNNTGAVATPASPNSPSRFVRYGLKGSADIIGILNDGRFLAIECKTAKGRPTVEQRSFLDEIEYRGGVAILARSIEDVEHALIHPSKWSKKEEP
jgi:hypothetical protein